MATKEIQLPKDWSNQVFELESKIQLGVFQLEDVDRLMQLYSKGVEYYSGMNDEKYLLLTEKI